MPWFRPIKCCNITQKKKHKSKKWLIRRSFVRKHFRRQWLIFHRFRERSQLCSAEINTFTIRYARVLQSHCPGCLFFHFKQSLCHDYSLVVHQTHFLSSLFCNIKKRTKCCSLFWDMLLLWTISKCIPFSFAKTLAR